MKIRAFILALLLSLFSTSAVPALDIILPTENDALFTGRPEKFYMHVDRWTDGVQSTPWEGGMYGFVRNPRPTGEGIIYTRFHAGIDIRPLQRDARGNPLDEIRAISAGKVVHTSPSPGASNYGRYIVIEHQWDGCPYYSLYAHLGQMDVQPGDEVEQGRKIAVMGYTGRGIDRERAHLHLEVALLMNENFDTFYPLHWGSTPNRHGNFSGLNLRGVDVARLYKEARKNATLTIPEFLSKEEPFFHVELPGSLPVDLLKRYPWMAGDAPPADVTAPPGWRISFTQSGVPLRVRPLREPVSGVRVIMEKPANQPLIHLTHGLITGSGAAAALTKSGQRLIALLTHDPGSVAESAVTAPQLLNASGKTHKVAKGETLAGIASRFKVDAEELRESNGIKDPKLLQIGQVLVIPDATGETEARGGAVPSP